MKIEVNKIMNPAFFIPTFPWKNTIVYFLEEKNYNSKRKDKKEEDQREDERNVIL